MEAFECSFCGDCCRGFSAVNSGIEKARETGSERGPGYQFTGAENIGPGLYAWEAQTLGGKKRGLKCAPQFFVYDTKTERPLVVNYNLQYGDCPFLSAENKCTVYGERPLVCRSFPLVQSGISGSTLEFWRGECPRAFDVELPKAMTRREYVDLMRESYADVFLWAVAKDAARNWVFQEILSAEDDGLIKLLRDAPRKDAVRMADASTPVDLIGYFSEIKGGFKDELDDNLRKFYTLDYAKSLVE